MQRQSERGKRKRRQSERGRQKRTHLQQCTWKRKMSVKNESRRRRSGLLWSRISVVAGLQMDTLGARLFI